MMIFIFEFADIWELLYTGEINLYLVNQRNEMFILRYIQEIHIYRNSFCNKIFT